MDGPLKCTQGGDERLMPNRRLAAQRSRRNLFIQQDFCINIKRYSPLYGHYIKLKAPPSLFQQVLQTSKKLHSTESCTCSAEHYFTPNRDTYELVGIATRLLSHKMSRSCDTCIITKCTNCHIQLQVPNDPNVLIFSENLSMCHQSSRWRVTVDIILRSLLCWRKTCGALR